MIGWVKIHRKISDNPLWTLEPFTRGQAWVDLILLANHEKGFLLIRGIVVDVNRGQVGWSEKKLAKRWKWSRTKVRNFLKLLEKEQQITHQTDNKTSIITILNYNEHQNGGSEKDSRKTAEKQQKDSRKTAEKQQKDTNKNEKNEKNVKNEKKGKKIPPSFEEVKKYCGERKNNIDPQTFIDFYQSKNWMIGKNKMKCWKSSVRTWEKRSGANNCATKSQTFKAPDSARENY